MRFSRSPLTLLVTALLALLPSTSAEYLLETSSLAPCMTNSSFSASLFNVVFTPNNNTLTFDIVGVSTVTGNVTFDIFVYAYGLQIYKAVLNPCALGVSGLCPMDAAPLTINSNVQIPASALKDVPGIAYTIPDLDASVKLYFNSTTTGEAIACVQAELSNGKTVDQKAVSWTVAVIAGLALLISAVTSGLGHSNTAAHVAANALALFGYFQAQAFIGMTAIELPPIVASWCQDFAWSMGIIRVGFLQDICTWYQRSTGGTPSTILSTLSTQSVIVEKRSLDALKSLVFRGTDAVANVVKRASSGGTTTTGDTLILRGIKRVGFRADIEPTNIFLTGYIFFLIFIVFVILCVILFKLICEALVRTGRIRNDKFQDFRNGWTVVLKGCLFRLTLIGFPQMVVLCFWELYERDSAAEIVLAVFQIIAMMFTMLWAALKVVIVARRSVGMHKNPAYILYSDPATLNKWGFLYVQFKATAYYFITLSLGYIMIKGMFIAFSQSSGNTQAIALFIIELTFLVIVCVLRPYMDKKTNGFNIAICAINALNALFLLFFTTLFGLPGLAKGVMGIIFFVYNAVFALVLLIMILVASAFAIFHKNPDARYQPMRDDRGSFIKSQTQLTTELDALGATARGEGKHGFKNARIEDDDESFSGSSDQRVGGNSSAMAGRYADAPGPLSPRDPSMRSFQADGDSGRFSAPPQYIDEKQGYQTLNIRSGASSPAPPRFRDQSANGRASPSHSPTPWQRGAGYDH